MSTGTKIFNSFLTNFLLISKINLAESIFRRRNGKAAAEAANQRRQNPTGAKPKPPSVMQKQQRKILLLPTFCYIIFINEIQI